MRQLTTPFKHCLTIPGRAVSTFSRKAASTTGSAVRAVTGSPEVHRALRELARATLDAVAARFPESAALGAVLMLALAVVAATTGSTVAPGLA